MLVIDNFANLRIGVVIQLVDRTPEKVQHIMCNGVVECRNGLGKAGRDNLSGGGHPGIGGFLFDEELAYDNGEVVRYVLNRDIA